MLRSSFCTMLILLFFSISVIAQANVELDLIRPLYVYQNVIRGVHDYYNNTCIILFRGSSKSLETEKLENVEGLMGLQRYLSGNLSIRTAIMDFRTLKNKMEKTYHHIKRPLFVLLNDYDEIREQFAAVSKWIAMAYPTWLVFLRDDTVFEEFLSNVYIPFDCILLLTQRDSEGSGEAIRDVYRITNGDRLRWMRFGAWDATRGFHGPLLGLYQRRHDLDGYNIRVVSVDDPPVSRIVYDESSEVLGVSGFFGEVMQLLQEGMNCTFTFKEAKSWGVRLTNGTWTGSIGMLLKDEADLVATEFMMTSDRLDVVRFTTPVYTTKCRVYIKRPNTKAVKWNAYLAPFALDIWNAIGLTIIIVGLTIAGIEAFSKNSGLYPSMTDEARTTPSRFSEIIFLVFGAFCGQGMEPSTTDSLRLVHLCLHLTAVVVLAAYSAALISYLAIKAFVMPFTTMQGLLEDGTYRFAVVGDSADYSFFQNTTDAVLNVMFEQLLMSETNLPVNYLDGLKRVCREDKYAFMTLDNMATVLQGMVDCVLEPLDVIMQTTVAMAVPVNSPYRGIIDSNILLLRDSGILQRLLKIEWSKNVFRVKSGWSSVELEDATPLLIFMLSTFLITCLILLAERLIIRNRGKMNVSTRQLAVKQ